MQEKIATLEQSRTWELVTLPPGKKTVGCKWIYTVKLNPDGSLAHLKVRLVAKRYSQVYELTYVDTFSSVVKMTSVWILVPLAATYQWPLHQSDIKNSLLNCILDEEVYIKQPLCCSGGIKVCRLKKSLYGLKQSPRAWFGHFASVNQKLGLCRSEKNLYILTDTAWKESPASCICWSYCDHNRWHRGDW